MSKQNITCYEFSPLVNVGCAEEGVGWTAGEEGCSGIGTQEADRRGRRGKRH